MPRRYAITWTLVSVLAKFGSVTMVISRPENTWLMTFWIIAALIFACSFVFGCYWIRENHGEDLD